MNNKTALHQTMRSPHFIETNVSAVELPLQKSLAKKCGDILQKKVDLGSNCSAVHYSLCERMWI